MTEKRYLWAVQTEDGREVISAMAEVAKVGDVTVTVGKKGLVIKHGDEVIASEPKPPEGDLYLHRWPANDKNGTPVTRKVDRDG
jgi:hypothetical protein